MEVIEGGDVWEVEGGVGEGGEGEGGCEDEVEEEGWEEGMHDGVFLQRRII